MWGFSGHGLKVSGLLGEGNCGKGVRLSFFITYIVLTEACFCKATFADEECLDCFSAAPVVSDELSLPIPRLPPPQADSRVHTMHAMGIQYFIQFNSSLQKRRNTWLFRRNIHRCLLLMVSGFRPILVLWLWYPALFFLRKRYFRTSRW